jgi:CRISPR-associated protein Cas1
MSFHILHVFQHGATLAKERGFIVCRSQDKSERRLPHEDLRAVIIAARGVTLTSNFVSAVLETDGVILHCNESYLPCGITAPLTRVIDSRAYMNQVSRPRRLNERIWQRLLRGKTINQQRVLKHRELSSPHLELALKRNFIDEGNCAKRYWQLYFPAIGWSATRRDRKENSAPNQMLNYGYTVLGALCHRSLLVHGLTPTLGVKHTTRYKADPLVYDLMEPFRPIVDMMLAEFLREEDVSLRAWSKKVGVELREMRVQHERYSLKLMDAIDACASSMTRSYSAMSPEPFWVPEL